MRRLLVLLLLVPIASAHYDDPRSPHNLRISEGNQRLDVAWDPPNDAANLSHYRVNVTSRGVTESIRVSGTFYRHYGVNGIAYEFLVTAVYADGSEGPEAGPVRGIPRLASDLQYFEAGLVMTWLGILGYAALLARIEARLDRKTEQLDAHRGPRSK